MHFFELLFVLNVKCCKDMISFFDDLAIRFPHVANFPVSSMLETPDDRENWNI